jgi:hypothetical protein
LFGIKINFDGASLWVYDILPGEKNLPILFNDKINAQNYAQEHGWRSFTIEEYKNVE